MFWRCQKSLSFDLRATSHIVRRRVDVDWLFLPLSQTTECLNRMGEKGERESEGFFAAGGRIKERASWRQYASPTRVCSNRGAKKATRGLVPRARTHAQVLSHSHPRLRKSSREPSSSRRRALLLIHLRVALRDLSLRHQLVRAVRKGATVTPRARAALEVHAHLGLALRVIDANATLTIALPLATATTAAETTTAVVSARRRRVRGRRERPVRGLGVVIDVVHLAVLRVGNLPAGGQGSGRLIVGGGVAHAVLNVVSRLG